MQKGSHKDRVVIWVLCSLNSHQLAFTTLYINVDSKLSLEEDVAEASKYPVDCQCAYLSNIGCHNTHSVCEYHIPLLYS